MFSRFRRSKDRPPDLRIALLGTSGSGKSVIKYIILNINREGHSVDISRPSFATGTVEVDGKKILVIDTPGLFETSMDEDELIAEMKICAHQSSPGLHAFLLVIRLDEDLTDEETNIMEWIENFFGEDALRYTIILFTHADKLKNRSLDEFIRGRTDLQRLVNSCGGDTYAFNNRNSQKRDQVIELIQKIERMVLNNGGPHNTLQEFKRKEKSRLEWKLAKKIVVISNIIRRLLFSVKIPESKPLFVVSKSGGVVLANKAGLALIAAVAAAVGIGILRNTHQQRGRAHSI